MASEVVIYCNECGRIGDGGRTAKEVRAALAHDGWRTGLRGGAYNRRRDLCPRCASTASVIDGQTEVPDVG